jgi:hypothetical protein
MAKHNSVTLDFDDCAQKTIPVVERSEAGQGQSYRDGQRC